MKKITLQFITVAFFFLISNTIFAQVNFNASTYNGCGPLSVTFTPSGLTGAALCEWDFQDGSPKFYDSIPFMTSVTHTFTNAGYYSVRLNIYNSSNAYMSTSYGGGNIQVNGTSIGSNDSACVNDMMSFCMNGGQTNSYSWNFGDGATSTNGGCVDHAYATAGSYTVTLVANSGCGNQTATRKVVIAPGVTPHPNAWANNGSSCPGAPLSFNTNGYSSYSWNFGDSGSGVNNTSTVQYPSHSFTTVGTYTVTLTVMNGCGRTGSCNTTVSIVNNPPFPNQSWFKMDVNSSPACPNSNAGFNAPNGYQSYEWDFGDGSPLQTTFGNNNYINHTYGSSIGTYSVTVRVHSACGNDSLLKGTQVINNSGFFPTQNFQIYSNSPSCPNSKVGFEGPGGYVNYVWNYGDGSPVENTSYNNISHLFGAAITSYSVTVTVTNGCAKDTTISTILQIKSNAPFPTQNFSLNAQPNPACLGDRVNWNAPQGFISYIWDFGDGDSATTTDYNAGHSYLSNGTYNGSVKIRNGCGKDTTIYSSVVINNSGSFPNWLRVEANTSSCPDENLDFRASQNGYVSYSWDFGDGSPVETNNVEKAQHAYVTTGNYNVTCTVTNGCGATTTITTTVQVANNSPVNSNLSIKNVQSPSCPGDEVFFVPDQGGQSNYEYRWNFGDGSIADTTVGSGSSHIYLSAGTYTVSVIVTNGCGNTKAVSIIQNVGGTSSPSLRDANGKRQFGFPGGEGNNGPSANAGCAGDNIIFYFMGSAKDNLWDFGDLSTGIATEEMLVYGGDGSAFPVTIIKHAFANNGPYKVKLTITNGCGKSVTDSIDIVIGGNLLVSGDMTTSPPPFSTCASIDFLGFGGASYDWNFGDGPILTTSSPTVTHTFSTAGAHLVSVLVTNGCGNSELYSKTINVSGGGGPVVTLSSSNSPTCINDMNGSATVTVSSANPPFTYSWDDVNAQATPTATGLAPGLYNATVTDAMGCASTLAVSINNPAPIVLGVSTTATSCGGSTGTASVSVSSGGTGPYTYQWSTGATGASISGLSAGAYSVVTTDNNACTSLTNVSISESGGATLSVASSTNNTCYGASTGAIDLAVTGGSSPYTYAWSNGSTSQDLTGLSSGSYSVQVTDNNGCKAILNKTITSPSIIVVNNTVVTSPTCGNHDGKAMATPSGGTGPYTYKWDSNTGNQTVPTAVGLYPGTYNDTIKDANQCIMVGEISLSNSNAPNITAVVSDVTCHGLNNGSINITVTGGTGPYGYQWNVGPPQTYHQNINNLVPGSYFVSLNDAAGCNSFRIYTINEPATLSVTATGTGATCFTSNGTATAVPVGGNTTYSYLWTGGKSTQTATGLSVGNYTVTVTDNKGCTATASKNVAVAPTTPSICMVTVDDASVNNIIYWDKTQYQHVDSFIVYREVSSNVYKRIAALKDTALSEYVDINRSVGPANGDPNVGAYRYKLQLRDSCGNYSALSPYHNTIYIIDATNGQFTWNLPYTVEGGANPVANYDLICDLANANSWFSTGTVAGTQSSATDPAFASRPSTARWRVKTIWGISCTPTRAGVNTTRSNIKSAAAATNISGTELNNEVTIYPNPATATLNIQYAAGYKKYQLQLFDALGQLVHSEELTGGVSGEVITKQLDVSTFRKGLYIINLQTENGNTFKRVAIQ